MPRNYSDANPLYIPPYTLLQIEKKLEYSFSPLDRPHQEISSIPMSIQVSHRHSLLECRHTSNVTLVLFVN